MNDFHNQLQALNVDQFQASQPVMWDPNQQQSYPMEDSRLIPFGCFGCLGCFGCFFFGGFGGCGRCGRCGGCGRCGRCGR